MAANSASWILVVAGSLFIGFLGGRFSTTCPSPDCVSCFESLTGFVDETSLPLIKDSQASNLIKAYQDENCTDTSCDCVKAINIPQEVFASMLGEYMLRQQRADGSSLEHKGHRVYYAYRNVGGQNQKIAIIRPLIEVSGSSSLHAVTTTYDGQVQAIAIPGNLADPCPHACYCATASGTAVTCPY